MSLIFLTGDIDVLSRGRSLTTRSLSAFSSLSIICRNVLQHIRWPLKTSQIQRSIEKLKKSQLVPVLPCKRQVSLPEIGTSENFSNSQQIGFDAFPDCNPYSRVHVGFHKRKIQTAISESIVTFDPLLKYNMIDIRLLVQSNISNSLNVKL